MKIIEHEKDIEYKEGNVSIFENKENAIICPHCGGVVPNSEVARSLGSRTSEKKKKSSRENGKKGGRPPKKKVDK